MGYTLVPRNKTVEPFEFGAFSWSWMLDTGVGLAIGTGKGISPATYRYILQKGKDPRSNDGYYVTSKQAKVMGLVASGLVSVERGKNHEYSLLSEEERRRRDVGNRTFPGLYSQPVRDDFVDKAERFAIWAPTSGGFWIR